MLDPTHLLVLENQTPIFEDGYGQQEASRVAVVDFYDGHTMPNTEQPAIKGHGAHGEVYVPKEGLRYIADLTGDEFQPVER